MSVSLGTDGKVPLFVGDELEFDFVYRAPDDPSSVSVGIVSAISSAVQGIQFLTLKGSQTHLRVRFRILLGRWNIEKMTAALLPAIQISDVVPELADVTLHERTWGAVPGQSGVGDPTPNTPAPWLLVTWNAITGRGDQELPLPTVAPGAWFLFGAVLAAVLFLVLLAGGMVVSQRLSS